MGDCQSSQRAGSPERERPRSTKRDEFGGQAPGEAHHEDPGAWLERCLAIPIDDPGRLNGEESLFEFLNTKAKGTELLPVRLLRMTWIIEQASKIRAAGSLQERQGLALKRRQEMPEEAYITVDDVRQCKDLTGDLIINGRVAVISTSYCWRKPEHPDEDGDTLVALAASLEEQQRGHQFFPSEAGVFVDWSCIHQKPRSEQEDFAFKAALANLDYLYAHRLATTVMLTDLPTQPSYHHRGWPSYEYSVSCLVKTTDSHIFHAAIDSGSPCKKPLQQLPQTPDAFKKDLGAKAFTNGSDKEVVLQIYEYTLARAYRGATKLGLTKRGWSQDEWVAFAPLLRLCERVEELKMGFNGMTDGALAGLSGALVPGTLPRLRTLDLGGNAFGALGLGALGSALAAGVAPGLRRCSFWRCPSVDDAALAAFTAAIEGGGATALDELNLLGCSVGDEGLLALAQALERGAMPSLRYLSLGDDGGTQATWDRIRLVRPGLGIT